MISRTCSGIAAVGPRGAVADASSRVKARPCRWPTAGSIRDLQRADQLVPLHEHHHGQRGDQRLGRQVDAPPGLAQQELELLLALAGQDVGRTLGPAVLALAGVDGDAAVPLEGADRAVDRAGLDVGVLLEPPAQQLAPHVVPVHRLLDADDPEHQEPRRRHAASILNLDRAGAPDRAMWRGTGCRGDVVGSGTEQEYGWGRPYSAADASSGSGSATASGPPVEQQLEGCLVEDARAQRHGLLVLAGAGVGPHHDVGRLLAHRPADLATTDFVRPRSRSRG